ncbi:MAG TPA: diguanylate cyclase [Pilimelia sp.]|nr:diguanylate cyclase [Pilimelia sp.]
MDQDPRQPISDPLTGAYSRALLGPRLAEELSRAARSHTGCALFLFDVDYFKSVNDAYGHQRGDQVLHELTRRINGLIRGYDVLFRYGGDEFVLLLPETAKADAVRVALRLTEAIRSTPFPGDPPLSVSVSLGVAAFPDDASDADGLLAAADRRNYLAKHRGRACAVADDAEADHRPASSRLLERDVPLSTARDFLTRIMIGEEGALRVAGEPGAGHTRFLEEVVRAGRLRGYHIVAAADPDTVAAGPPGKSVLVVLDAEPDDRVPAMVRRLRDSGAPAVGLVYRAASALAPPPDVGLPLYDTVELLGWSPAAVRIWLRTTLQGEPSRLLVDWLVERTAGLPARVAREVERLTEREALLRTDSGWTIAPAVLSRVPRRRRPLPMPMTELVGRQHETAQVAQLLAAQRIVTLVGPGGIGKTRLTLAVAAAVADRFDDGVAFVPLDAVRTEPELLAALASALDVAEVPRQALRDTLVEHLADQSVLLVLDNFDQGHDAADVLNELLTAAPRVRALVSSRERIGLYGEQAYPVPPLGLPDSELLAPTPAGAAQALAGSPALALFQARARAVAYDFAVTAQNLTTVAALCRRLDGLPLAIELAAAHSDVLSPGEMLDQLTRRLDLPGAAPRGLPQRQQTMRDAIDWSVTLLEPQEQELLVRLGVFVGGARLESVVAVHPDDDDPDKRIGRLVDKGLVRAVPEEAGCARYSLLETVRVYALERLLAGAHADAVRRAHAEHFAAFAERAGAQLTGPDQAAWMGRIDREYPNLHAAFAYCLDTGDDGAAVRVAVGLWRFWRNTGRLRQGREWLDRLMARDAGLSESARARVRHAAAVLAAAQDEHATAAELAAESLALARAAGDARTGAQAGNALGIAAMTAGDYLAARAYYQDSLAVWEQLGDPIGTAMAHGNLTMVALRLGDKDLAGHHAARCLELERAQGNTRGIMLGLLCLGQIELARARTGRAREHLREALALSRRASDVFGEAMALHQLGLAALADGDRAGAVRDVAAALALRREADDREDLAVSLDTLAALLAPDTAGAAGDATGADAGGAGGTGGPPPAPTLAAELLGAADGLRARYRLPTPTAERSMIVTRLRAVLTPGELELAIGTGRNASLDAVVDDALHHAHPAG